MEFEWDLDKEQSNVRKHRIGFTEAMTVFNDPFEITIEDRAHSLDEDRFLSLGTSEADRLLVVSYTERESERIRIIGARAASRRERRQYEQTH